MLNSTKWSFKFTAVLCLFVTGALITKAQERKQIVLRQSDPRFTVTAESHFASTGAWEKYFFTVRNNTSREYRMVLKVNMELGCVGSRSYTIGVNGTVYLPANGTFKPSQDHDHTINSPDSKNFKDCKIADNAGGFTLVRSVSYVISDVQDLTKIEEDKAAAKKSAMAQQSAKVAQPVASNSPTGSTAVKSSSVATDQSAAGSQVTNSSAGNSTAAAQTPVQTAAQRQAETARTLAEIERQRNEKQADVQRVSDAVVSAGSMFADAMRADAAAKAAREERQEQLNQQNWQTGSQIYQQNYQKAQAGDEAAIGQVIYAQRLMNQGFEDFASQMVGKYGSATARTALVDHYQSVMQGYKTKSQAHLRKGIGWLVLTGVVTGGLIYLSDEAIQNDGVNSSDAETYTYIAGGAAIVGSVVSVAQFSKIGYKNDPGYLDAKAKLQKLTPAQTLSLSPVFNRRSNSLGLALRLNF